MFTTIIYQVYYFKDKSSWQYCHHNTLEISLSSMMAILFIIYSSSGDITSQNI